MENNIKARLGDIYSISTKKGFGFLQFVKSPANDKSDVELVKVSYDLHTKIPDDIERFFLNDFFMCSFLSK
ncbi:hypothetical protein SAMN05444408_12124 [Chryseobacterium takakiae]|uniref:Uncharacterized protein n=1 Tax=Chryseobacterium takakiae TaxID=1302685 RepID=A0A1M5BPN1_9FLAO|nr:hypothetical protein SAMN05444408_12124 [Chryseobacterium takakiae]